MYSYFEPTPPSSSGYSTEETVNNLYNVKVPSIKSQEETGGYAKHSVKITLGRIDQHAKSMVARAPQRIDTIQAPLLDLSRDFLNSTLNPLTLSFIFLAVVSAIYSSIGQNYVRADAEITDTRIFALPYVAAAVQENTIGGFNSTTYNLIKTADATISSLSESYLDTQKELCNVLNDKSSSPSSSSDHFLTKYGRSVSVTNPNQWSFSHCDKSLQARNDMIESAYSTINSLGSAMLANITSLMNSRIPAVNASLRNEEDFNTMKRHVKHTGVCWIVIFSCLSALSVVIYGCFDYVTSKYETEEKVAEAVAKHALEKKNGVEHCQAYFHFQNFACNCGSAYRTITYYFIDSNINRLLYIALILALLGLSNGTILKSTEKARILHTTTTSKTWYQPSTAAYSQYESSFNNISVNLFSNFVNLLNANHQSFSRDMENKFGFSISSSVPFPNGVALNVISLPLTNGRKLPDNVLVPGTSLHEITGVLRSLRVTAVGCWVSAIVLFCSWACCTLCYNIF